MCVEKQRKKKKKWRRRKKEKYKKWKCRESFQDFGVKKSDKHKEKKVSEGMRRQPQTRRIFGKCGKWLFLLLMLVQSWGHANAASEEAQGRNESATRMWQQMEVKERSWEEAFPKKLRRKGGQDRTGMQEEAKKIRCTLLNGSEPLLEAVVKRARATGYPWLTACDANMSPRWFMLTTKKY